MSRDNQEIALQNEVDALREYMGEVPEAPQYNAHPPEMGYKILAYIVKGYSFKAIARMPGMPSEVLIAWWCAGNFEAGAAGVVSTFYAHARVAQGEQLASESVRMVRELADGITEEGGAVKPDAFKRYRVALDSLRWMLPKMARATWGDELHVKHSGQVSLQQIAQQQEQRGTGVLGKAKGRVFDGKTGAEVFPDERDGDDPRRDRQTASEPDA